MKKIIVEHFGPIHHCELEMKNFMIFTGPQASGKSTIAKLIFFFKNIGALMMEEIRKNILGIFPANTEDKEQNAFSEEYFKRILLSRFQQVFGEISHQNAKMKLVAYYSKNSSIKICVSQKDGENDLDIRLSKGLLNFIEKVSKKIKECDVNSWELGKKPNPDEKDEYSIYQYRLRVREVIREEGLHLIEREIQEFFSEGRDIVYIPAGRSIMTLLSTQWDYLYSTMDDRQKRNFDYCTRNYLERILKLKPAFGKTIDFLIKTEKSEEGDTEILYLAKKMMEEILQGEYQYLNGEERLKITREQSVKINFASSGQQEALWILNMIFDALLLDKKSLFIIEEPESNLFPNAQKLVAEFISLAQNKGKNQILITTHSPYILGTVNNLLYARKIEEKVEQGKLDEIISVHQRIDFNNFSAYFMKNGEPEDCTDREFHSIRNEVIDAASEDINRDFEKMLDLMEKNQ